TRWSFAIISPLSAEWSEKAFRAATGLKMRTRGAITQLQACIMRPAPCTRELRMSILWTIIIGFIAGVIAKLIHSGPNEPSGFILTTLLGIAGAFVATYLGQAIGWYRAGEGAGFIGSIVGAVIVLLVCGFIAPRMRRA